MTTGEFCAISIQINVHQRAERSRERARCPFRDGEGRTAYGAPTLRAMSRGRLHGRLGLIARSCVGVRFGVECAPEAVVRSRARTRAVCGLFRSSAENALGATFL